VSAEGAPPPPLPPPPPPLPPEPPQAARNRTPKETVARRVRTAEGYRERGANARGSSRALPCRGRLQVLLEERERVSHLEDLVLALLRAVALVGEHDHLGRDPAPLERGVHLQRLAERHARIARSLDQQER